MGLWMGFWINSDNGIQYTKREGSDAFPFLFVTGIKMVHTRTTPALIPSTVSPSQSSSKDNSTGDGA